MFFDVMMNIVFEVAAKRYRFVRKASLLVLAIVICLLWVAYIMQ